MAVVDDHPLFRDGVIDTLAGHPSFEVVAQGSSAEDAIRIAEQDRPDVMLIDLFLPGGGIVALRAVTRMFPQIKTIVLTVSESELDVLSSFSSGARAYVLKGISGPDLRGIIRAVIKGDTYVAPSLTSAILGTIQSHRARGDQAEAHLTAREDEILSCVGGGLTNKEVARKLEISEKTVKHYMTNIMQKLKVRNRVEAALSTRRPHSYLETQSRSARTPAAHAKSPH